MRSLHSYFESPDKTPEYAADGGGAVQWLNKAGKVVVSRSAGSWGRARRLGEH